MKRILIGFYPHGKRFYVFSVLTPSYFLPAEQESFIKVLHPAKN
jgi:hypothetical protein